MYLPLTTVMMGLCVIKKKTEVGLLQDQSKAKRVQYLDRFLRCDCFVDGKFAGLGGREGDGQKFSGSGWKSCVWVFCETVAATLLIPHSAYKLRNHDALLIILFCVQLGLSLYPKV